MEEERFKSAKDLGKRKDDILERLGKSIEAGKPFMVLAEGSTDQMATMGGSPEDLARMFSIAMSKIPVVEKIIRVAVDALEYSRESKETDSDIVESLGCSDCPKKDSCPIPQSAFAKGERTSKAIAELMEEMSKAHPDMVDIGLMSKGGDA